MTNFNPLQALGTVFDIVLGVGVILFLGWLFWKLYDIGFRGGSAFGSGRDEGPGGGFDG